VKARVVVFILSLLSPSPDRKLSKIHYKPHDDRIDIT
jgi:hypothetical protein